MSNECPNHGGAFDCSPFCELCEGNQETGKEKEMEKTETKLVAWNGETYKGASDYYDRFQTDEYAEHTEDLDPDELLRLALFAHNGYWKLVPEDLPALIAGEQEAYWGEYDSGADLAQDITEHADPLPDGLPNWIVIDWEASWERNLRHDFFEYEVIDIDGNYRRFFWRAY